MAKTNKFKFCYFSPLILVVIIIFVGVLVCEKIYTEPKMFESHIDPQKVLSLTNQYRENNGLPALKYSPLLENAAKLKAEDMLSKHYFAHESFNGTGLDYWLKKSGYRFRVAGENLSSDFYTEEGVVNAWMRSEIHRENILDKDFTEIGLASLGGRITNADTVIVVQIFGDPINAR